MPVIPQQLPAFCDFPETPPPAGHCQRWYQGWHSWTPRSAGGFQAEKYHVAAIPEAVARDYVLRHHYSSTYPCARRRYGLFVREETGFELVGVAVFGIPMQARVLTSVLPDLEPYVSSLELSRFVLEGEPQSPGRIGGRAPGNAESWFLARALRLLAADGVEAVVAFSDPVSRCIDGRTLWPGHYGVIYQASSAVYTGRGTARTLTVLRDGTSLSARSISKVLRQESGHAYVERRLVAMGASARGISLDPATWLRDALDAVGAVRIRHRGCHRFVLPTSSKARRSLRIAPPALPYPKAVDLPGS